MRGMAPRISIITPGCPKNIVETDFINARTMIPLSHSKPLAGVIFRSAIAPSAGKLGKTEN
ncbi:MAG TPA: hypothetical protein DCW86_00500 [Actinobacteria bacterium]|nr:hypothetical protein [Actinomycetota bacterium]